MPSAKIAPPTKIAASPSFVTASPPFGPSGAESCTGRPARSHPVAGVIDREHLLDRLAHLRTILPVFAQELATARRQAAALRVENRGLLDEVRRLRRQRGESGHS
jgi:hypothetical protein